MYNVMAWNYITQVLQIWFKANCIKSILNQVGSVISAKANAPEYSFMGRPILLSHLALVVFSPEIIIHYNIGLTKVYI